MVVVENRVATPSINKQLLILYTAQARADVGTWHFPHLWASQIFSPHAAHAEEALIITQSAINYIVSQCKPDNISTRFN
jgi:hypothetical protein